MNKFTLVTAICLVLGQSVSARFTPQGRPGQWLQWWLQQRPQGPPQQPGDGVEEPVMEIAVRKINDCPDCRQQFEQTREAFINLLRQQPGVQIDAEFEALLDSEGQTVSDVFVGMTQYDSLEVYQTIQNTIGNDSRAAAFLQTVTPQCFVIVKASDPNRDVVNLGSLGTSDCNLVRLEIRDLKSSERFYERALRRYDNILRTLPGVIVTNNYESLINDQHASTTLYTNMDDLTSAESNFPEESVRDKLQGTFDTACLYILRRLN